jgi:hypothetical protein
MKPNPENNHPPPGTISNASTDSTIIWDNDNNNIINRFSNTLSMSTNGELNKTSTAACCCSCEHTKCTKCISHQQSFTGFTNVALNMTDECLDSLETGFNDDGMTISMIVK